MPYLTQQQYRTLKSRLTRAENSGDPVKIVSTCREFFDQLDDSNSPYPDDWHRWRIAEIDALAQLHREAYRR